MTTGASSTAWKPGDVVLVPFPFRDRLAESARPAVVVSTTEFNSYRDVIVAAITSHAPRQPSDCALQDWAAAGLQRKSTVRMLVATLDAQRILHQIGSLSDVDWIEVQQRLTMAIDVSC